MHASLALAVNLVFCCGLVHAQLTNRVTDGAGQDLVLRDISEHPTLASVAKGWDRIPQDFSTSGIAVVVLDGDTAYTWFAGERDPGSGLPIDADTFFTSRRTPNPTQQPYSRCSTKRVSSICNRPYRNTCPSSTSDQSAEHAR